MTNQHLPWPIPDPRARLWATQYADMHEIVAPLEDIPDHTPPAAASVITTARELIRHSYYRHEFAAIGVATSIIAVEAALAARYGRGRLVDYINRAADDGLITADEKDMFHTGREIRNGYAHGKTTHAALTWPLAVRMVRTSLDLILLLEKGGEHPTGEG